MQKYYCGHECVYRKLEAEGKSAWGDAPSVNGKSFEESMLSDLLSDVLKDIAAPYASKHALDLGCGTGPVSCFLAGLGFHTHGIDVSPTAVELARKIAAERGLEHATFEVADIVDYPDPTPRYDLIVDAACLHCVVLDEDRSQALACIRKLLKPEGLFVVHTMAFASDEFLKTERYQDKKLDGEFILWHRIGDRQIFAEDRKIDGAWYMPQRRILPREALLDELARAEFTVQWSRLEDGDLDSTALLEALCVSK